LREYVEIATGYAKIANLMILAYLSQFTGVVE
jgi:hypothetical protein